MNEIIEIANFVGTAVWRTWPLFALSIILSVVIRQLKLDGLIRKAFSANVGKAILLATLVGAFSPFCSCTVIPIVAGLLLSGVPLAPVMSFWIASPTMDPEIFALSVGILGMPMALARLIATLSVSLAAGYLTHALGTTTWLREYLREKQDTAVAHVVPSPSLPPVSLATTAVSIPFSEKASTLPIAGTCGSDGCGDVEEISSCGLKGSGFKSSGFKSSGLESCASPSSEAVEWRAQLKNSYDLIRWRELGDEFLEQSWNLGRWILLAFLLEALITRYIPQAAIAGILGDNNPLAVPLAALVGIPLYLNNFSALPIVSGLLSQGMQPGAAIAFLIAGPITTIPAMTAVYGTVQRHVFILYISIALFGAVFIGFATNLFLS